MVTLRSLQVELTQATMKALKNAAAIFKRPIYRFSE